MLKMAQVVERDAVNGKLYVILKNSGMMFGAPIQIGYDGYADGYRINQNSLPEKGTWGLIGFPDDDLRNGMWIKSIYASQINAITTDTGETDTKYYSHKGGFWSMLDVEGNSTVVYPDGTSLTVNATGTIPAVYRNTVENQVQTRVAVTQAERVPTPIAPKIINLITATGVNVNIDVNGSILVDTTNAKNGNVTLTVKGNVTANVTGNLNATITGTATASAASWSMTGNVTWTGNMQVNGNIQASGSIADHNATYGTVNSIRVVYNGHAHNGVQTGTGTTDLPDNLMP